MERRFLIGLLVAVSLFGASFSVSEAAPAKPTDLSATPRSACAIQLGWEQTTPGAYYYLLDRSRDGFQSWSSFRWPSSGDLQGAPFMGEMSLRSAGEGLFSMSSYWHRIRSCDNSAQNPCSEWANFVDVDTLPLPSNPGNPSITRVQGVLTGLVQDVEIEWTTSTNVTQYSGFSIFRSTDGGLFINIGDSDLFMKGNNGLPEYQRPLSFTDIGLDLNSYYTYRVYGYDSDFACRVEQSDTAGPTQVPNNQAVFSSYSSEPLVPVRPTSILGVYDEDANTVLLTWEDNSANETQFKIVKSTDPNFSTVVPGITTEFITPTDTTSYLDDDVIANVIYYYKVHACTGDEICSARSNIDILTTGIGRPVLDVMVIYVSASDATANVFASWQGVAPVESYELQRSDVNDFSTYDVVETIDVSAQPRHYDNGVPVGQVYYYRLRANASGGESSFSTIIPLNLNIEYVLRGQGWALADDPHGVGWVKFNSLYDDSSEGSNRYSVHVDSSGLISGEAWTDNYGWLSFNAGHLNDCPSGTCEARMDLASGAFSGWTRFLAPRLRAGLGAWDGWVHLSGSDYGAEMEITTGALTGAVWGSDIAGWMGFGPPLECANCTVRGERPGVIVVNGNNAPLASNVQIVLGDDGWAADNPYYEVVWDYGDIDGDVQQEAEIEFYRVADDVVSKTVVVSGSQGLHRVSDPLGWMDEGVYNYPNYLNTETEYRVRVRVYDGTNWSGWADSPAPGVTTPTYYDFLVCFVWEDAGVMDCPSWDGTSVELTTGEPVTFYDETVDRSGGMAPLTGWQWTFENASKTQSAELIESVVFGDFPSNVMLCVTDTGGTSTCLEQTLTGDISAPVVRRRIIKEK